MFRDHNRLAVICLAAVGLVGAGLIGWGVAGAVEERVERRLQAQIAAAGFAWLTASVDGSHVVLRGEAPDETTALAAHTLAAGAGRWIRVDDRMALATGGVGAKATVLANSTETLSLTVLRDGASLALMGRASGEAHDALVSALEAENLTDAMVDLTVMKPGALPPAWARIASASARITGALRHGLVEIRAGHVTVNGMPDNAIAPRRVAGAVEALREAGVVVETAIAHPEAQENGPPVFAASFHRGVPHIDACTAPNEATGEAIVAGASALLDAPHRPCKVDPAMTGDGWLDATQAGLAALASMEGGRFELYGNEARLIPPQGGVDERYEAAAATLAAALPAGYAVPLNMMPTTVVPDTAGGIAWFRVVRNDDIARILGTVPDSTTHDAVVTYAAAVLDAGDTITDLRVAPVTMREGWRQAALATLDGLAPLDRGEAVLRGDTIRISGVALDTTAVVKAQRALGLLDGRDWQIRSEITVDLPAALAARQLSPAACETALRDIKAAQPIAFAPGEASLDNSSSALLDRLAETLRRCKPTIIEIGGHTDSQGSEAYNLRLSAARAAAVRRALLDRDPGSVRLLAQGYGPRQPVADNATEAGRARNRRIAFVHILPGETAPAPTEAPATEPTTAVMSIEDAPVAIKPVPRP